ncbi:MAG: helix-turn-helix transcriptional regulator [Eubacteriales bacterium]|nr:helix-turn-helix transcriptional regulator [Eubacteriales bacterium]
MSFGTIIKKLRRERDLTQEQLAEMLSISPQAVSHWETDAAMPDISMLAPLCNLFNVTSDRLLGIDIEKKREKIEAICAESGKYSDRGYNEKAREILEAGLREYPDSCDIMHYLMYVAYWQYINNNEKTKYRDEAIRLGEAILEKSTDDSLRQGAMQILCYTYCDAGRQDEAVRLAKSIPCIAVSSEILLSSICSGDEGYEAKQKEASTLMQFLSRSLYSMQTKLDSGAYAYTESELAALRDKRIALLHLFFENGDYGFYHCHLCDTHTEQAIYYAKAEDGENAIAHLHAAAEHAVGFVTSDGGGAYTSLVFRGLARGSWSGSSPDNDAARLMKRLDDTVFDGLRKTSEFEAVKAKLSAYAGKWQVK